ncbi:unnamed protein product, partial [Mesorhabditis spiculigera]
MSAALRGRRLLSILHNIYHEPQLRLVLLLHAKKCKPKAKPCKIPFCYHVKCLLSHMEGCWGENYCNLIICHRSRELLTHWRECRNAECGMCKPFEHLRPLFPYPGPEIYDVEMETRAIVDDTPPKRTIKKKKKKIKKKKKPVEPVANP